MQRYELTESLRRAATAAQGWVYEHDGAFAFRRVGRRYAIIQACTSGPADYVIDVRDVISGMSEGLADTDAVGAKLLAEADARLVDRADDRMRELSQ